MKYAEKVASTDTRCLFGIGYICLLRTGTLWSFRFHVVCDRIVCVSCLRMWNMVLYTCVRAHSFRTNPPSLSLPFTPILSRRMLQNSSGLLQTRRALGLLNMREQVIRESFSSHPPNSRNNINHCLMPYYVNICNWNLSKMTFSSFCFNKIVSQRERKKERREKKSNDKMGVLSILFELEGWRNEFR